MSTTCTIAIQDDHGRFRSIYCNYDGYPEHMLKVLNEHFNKRDDASLLIKGGDVRFVDDTGTVDYYSERGENWAKIKPRDHLDNQTLIGETRDTNYTYIFIGVHSGTWLGA